MISAASVGLGERTLGDVAVGRDNNFNLVRFLAAFAVLFSHSFALSSGDPATEPLRDWLGVTPGTLAVDVFFITSGFLVTASLMQRQHLRQFVWARVLRIYPALLVAVLLTVVAVGLRFTSLPWRAFAAEPQTWEYLVRNATLVTGIVHRLPGAFEAIPWRHAVNASLWTLPYEIAMYAGLAMLWLGLRGSRAVTARRFSLAVGTVFVVCMTTMLLLRGYVSSNALRLAAMFFCGATMYALRDRIVFDRRLLWLSLLVLALASLNLNVFARVYPLALPYAVIYAAYAPSPALHNFNRLGDCSYGLYIYAWPVQQMTAALLPGIGAAAMLGVSFTATLTLALLSWHLVERRALALKSRPVHPRTRPRAE